MTMDEPSGIKDVAGETLISKVLVKRSSSDPACRKKAHSRSRGKALLKKTASLKNAFILSEIFCRRGD
jgi:hypothetical protein